MKAPAATRDHPDHVQNTVRTTAPGEMQGFERARRKALGLDAKAVGASLEGLQQLLADTITLRDLYKKHHWQAAGPTFYMLHLLFDKHAEEQSALVDLLAERIQTLGGVSIAIAPDVAEMTRIPRPPRDREETPAQLSRLLDAHEIILVAARTLARDTAAAGDVGTNDILASDIVRVGELQVWFVAQHVG
ncbi:MAG: DNA starvation/stationary phase protection protein [Phycisphaerales bacterium]|nr:DNA starvation/stationary phase protection protein [Phycisphaerales bacterium]